MSDESYAVYRPEQITLKCGNCGEVLFTKEEMTPPHEQMYTIDFRHTAYSCLKCDHIGTPIVETEPLSADHNGDEK